MSTRSSRPAPRTSLLPVLGLFFGIAVAVGGTLGVGILRQPGPVASYLRHPWLIMLMWFGGAVYSALGAANFSELATMIPRAGGFYVYTRAALGDYAGFAVGWSDFLVNVASVGAAAVTAVEFLARLVPGIRPVTPEIATVTVLAFAAMQWSGIRLSARVQQAASVAGALALVGLVVGCFMAPAAANTQPAPALPATSFIAAMVLAIQSIVVTYDGWYEPIYFAEDTNHPSGRIPRAMFGGLAILTVIFLLLNAAFLRVLGPGGLAASTFAAADAARITFGRVSELLVSAIAIIVLLTLVHTVLMSATRILFGVSRDGLFWRRAAVVAGNGTPRAALALSTFAVVVLMLTGTIERLIAIAGFFAVTNYCSAYISLIALRRLQPAARRPFRVCAFPFLTLLPLAGSLAFLVGAVISDRRNSIYALLLVLASFPVRWLLAKWR